MSSVSFLLALRFGEPVAASCCLGLAVAVKDSTFTDSAGKQEVAMLELSTSEASSSLCVAKPDSLFGRSFVFFVCDKGSCALGVSWARSSCGRTNVAEAAAVGVLGGDHSRG